jgi:hypothetical protein
MQATPDKQRSKQLNSPHNPVDEPLLAVLCGVRAVDVQRLEHRVRRASGLQQKRGSQTGQKHVMIGRTSHLGRANYAAAVIY